MLAKLEIVGERVFPCPVIGIALRLRCTVGGVVERCRELKSGQIGAIVTLTIGVVKLRAKFQTIDGLYLGIGTGLYIVAATLVLIHVIVHIGNRIGISIVADVPIVAIGHTVAVNIVLAIVVVGVHEGTHDKHVMQSVPIDAACAE